jgi:hypothetical protein
MKEEDHLQLTQRILRRIPVYQQKMRDKFARAVDQYERDYPELIRLGQLRKLARGEPPTDSRH